MPGTSGTSSRRPVSPLRRIAPTNSDSRNQRTRRSASSTSSFTSPKPKNPDYGRFTPLVSQTQATSSNASKGNSPNRFYPTPSPPPLDLEPPAPVELSEETPKPEGKKAYTSLPSTPVLGATIPEFPKTARLESIEPRFIRQSNDDHQEPFSLWDYLREELLATDFDSHQELKWERVTNFLNIPIAIEKIVGFGYILCLDSFLHTFTIQPIRFVLAAYQLFVNCITFSRYGYPISFERIDFILFYAHVLIMLFKRPESRGTFWLSNWFGTGFGVCKRRFSNCGFIPVCYFGFSRSPNISQPARDLMSGIQ
ncbi:hypothetical protein RSAG8_10463, partial [Rhizoctonia solani AG-8 WAC10335]